MAIHVDEGIKKQMYFTISASVFRFTLAASYTQVLILVPRARIFAQYAIVGNSVIAIIYLCSAWTPVPATIVLWLIASLLGDPVWVKLTYLDRRASIPINIEHTAERYGCFIMLMLGESVLAIVTEHNVDSWNDFLITYFGFWIIYALMKQYTGAQPHNPDNHALRVSNLRGRVFLYSHILLGFALIGLGTGLKMIKLHSDKHNEISTIDYHLFAYSLVTALVSINICRLSHKFESRNLFVWAARLIVILIVSFFEFMSNGAHFHAATVIVIFALLVVCLNLVDTVAGDVTVPDDHHAEAKHNEKRIPHADVKVEMQMRHAERVPVPLVRRKKGKREFVEL
eukprot:CAMPEP_0197515032 /NCGR_PEP_ID=MMETSP1318-20131121/283_1 /TAXON_ID=552666 /ORGANISM="Partenskyella glossopodia, Strain RCC365" /LENGTH=340 /DNA_ID=CAMNT_0043063285 /DNA_START=646 /DNA_END=1668 /DNA_ORIENTATION=+